MVLEKTTVIESLQQEIQAKLELIDKSHQKEIASLEKSNLNYAEALKKNYTLNKCEKWDNSKLEWLKQTYEDFERELRKRQEEEIDRVVKESKDKVEKMEEVGRIKDKRIKEIFIIEEKHRDTIRKLTESLEKEKKKVSKQSAQIKELAEILDKSFIEIERKDASRSTDSLTYRIHSKGDSPDHHSCRGH